ncbi:MAG: DUF188 domain-containing protein [Legionella sp.]|nr:MAG: DUF188 domain-containing protein [Legionella sp.]PJD99576.1 MAG: DUF188 domain-containing protein [Legionella sp.]
MNIWIDGDSCPKPIKQILFRAAMARKVPLLIVANHLVVIPSSPFVKRVLVESGFDVADNYIVAHLQPQDLVITGDIILADYVIDKQGMALSPRGVLYTPDNVKQMVTMRNLNESLRSSGLVKGGPSQFTAKDIQLFSNHLDKMITKYGGKN